METISTGMAMASWRSLGSATRATPSISSAMRIAGKESCTSARKERKKEYAQAPRVIGRRPLAILVFHVLPNVFGPVLVIATINIAVAIITEATRSEEHTSELQSLA